MLRDKPLYWLECLAVFKEALSCAGKARLVEVSAHKLIRQSKPGTCKTFLDRNVVLCVCHSTGRVCRLHAFSRCKILDHTWPNRLQLLPFRVFRGSDCPANTRGTCLCRDEYRKAGGYFCRHCLSVKIILRIFQALDYRSQGRHSAYLIRLVSHPKVYYLLCRHPVRVVFDKPVRAFLVNPVRQRLKMVVQFYA